MAISWPRGLLMEAAHANTVYGGRSRLCSPTLGEAGLSQRSRVSGGAEAAKPVLVTNTSLPRSSARHQATRRSGKSHKTPWFHGALRNVRGGGHSPLYKMNKVLDHSCARGVGISYRIIIPARSGVLRRAWRRLCALHALLTRVSYRCASACEGLIRVSYVKMRPKRRWEHVTGRIRGALSAIMKGDLLSYSHIEQTEVEPGACMGHGGAGKTAFCASRSATCGAHGASPFLGCSTVLSPSVESVVTRGLGGCCAEGRGFDPGRGCCCYDGGKTRKHLLVEIAAHVNITG